MAGTSRGSICGKVRSGRLTGAGEPTGEPREEAGGTHRILNLYHHLPDLDTANTSPLYASSLWWCSSWALFWAPSCFS